ncbi:Heavy metal-associated isoprenylated plant protein 39, partial [Mucuna pruriens]
MKAYLGNNSWEINKQILIHVSVPPYSGIKTVVSVELRRCSRCRQKVMKLIATIEGITSIVLNPEKNTVTVVGEADPVRIIKSVRKFRESADIVSVGPEKEGKKEEKKEKETKDDVSHAPILCHRCNVWHHWYVTVEDGYSHCSIL